LLKMDRVEALSKIMFLVGLGMVIIFFLRVYTDIGFSQLMADFFGNAQALGSIALEYLLPAAVLLIVSIVAKKKNRERP
jgi:hypothetical protein